MKPAHHGSSFSTVRARGCSTTQDVRCRRGRGSLASRAVVPGQAKAPWPAARADSRSGICETASRGSDCCRSRPHQKISPSSLVSIHGPSLIRFRDAQTATLVPGLITQGVVRFPPSCGQVHAPPRPHRALVICDSSYQAWNIAERLQSEDHPAVRFHCQRRDAARLDWKGWSR